MRKNISIKLITSEILHDVENIAYLTGKSARNDDNAEKVALMQASEDSEDSDRIMRSIGSSYNTLYDVMSEYIKDDTISSSNILWDRNTDLVINLVMPSNFNLAETDTISSASHDYVYNRTLGEWFNITNKEEAEGYYTMAAGALEVLKRALTRRIRPHRLDPVDGMMPTWSGLVSEDFIITENGVKALTMRRQENRSFIMEIEKMEQQKVLYAYPKDWESLVSIMDELGFELRNSFALYTINIDGVDYYCYILANQTTITSEKELKFR